jgi:hypothetical protein
MELAWLLVLRSAAKRRTQRAQQRWPVLTCRWERVDFHTLLLFGSSRTNCNLLDQWHAYTGFVCRCFALGSLSKTAHLQVPSAYLAKDTNGALYGHYWIAYGDGRNLSANTRNQNERVTQQGG